MGPGSLRASDRDRAEAVEVLQRAATEGYLTLDEFEDRIGIAYQARYLGELDKLLADIPGAVRPWGPPSGRIWSPARALSTPSASGGRPYRPHRALRICLAVCLALMVASVLAHLWLPLLIVGLIMWHRGWRGHQHRRYRRGFETV